MIKGMIFTIGLANGAYVGIKMRDSGFTNALTKNYYKRNNPQNQNILLNLEPRKLNELYEKGLLDSPEKLEDYALIKNVDDLVKMQEFLNFEKQDKSLNQSSFVKN